ncbi:MAG: hypothetical protein ACYDA6_00015 [Solirubrobacteraceae bacterium]
MAYDPLQDLTYSERFRLVRTRKRLSLREVADIARSALPGWVAMNREMVRRLEAGLLREEDINPFAAIALATALDVAPDYLFPSHGDHLAFLLAMIESRPPREAAAMVGSMGRHPVNDEQALPVLERTGSAKRRPSDLGKRRSDWSDVCAA